MLVKLVRLRNFRSFIDSRVIKLDRINVLIGANNSGKTTVLRALNLLQEGVPEPQADVRVGSTHAKIDIILEKGDHKYLWDHHFALNQKVLCSFDIHNNSAAQGSLVFRTKTGSSNAYRIKAIEPDHFIVPYLSKRKTTAYAEDISEERVLSVENNMNNLAAKLSRISNPSFPAYAAYSEACKEILGFVITSIPSKQGQRPGAYLSNQKTISIEQMGEGVPNIVHMLANIAVSEGKLFLVEEPENDLHPKALKALLRLIVESSKKNQFVVSTHSNIVASYLCSTDKSKLFRVYSESTNLPIEAKIEEVANLPSARVSVLQELGYSFSDFDLWDGWLILEESSAERIIRDYLIPWFTPRLSRVRTISAGGVGKVEATFDDLNRLVLFTHMQPAYYGKTWVIVDGDEPGKELVNKLRKKYPSWDGNKFNTFNEAQFEQYYPPNFSDDVKAIKQINDKQVLRNKKADLLQNVISWLDSDDLRAREALQQSAKEVIDKLFAIEQALQTK